MFCGELPNCSSSLASCMVLLLGMHLYRIAFLIHPVYEKNAHARQMLNCSSELGVYAYAAAQVKKAIEVRTSTFLFM